MSFALFALYFIILMPGSEAAGGQCKPSEKSANEKALKGHTFKEVAVKALIECQNLCESDHRCFSYNYNIPGMVCEMNSETKETKPYDFVTDDQRFYMKREDDDECMASPSVCDANANCKNTVGSYICACEVGFFGDGKTCTDIDECAQGSHDCLRSFASCMNTAGSYNCSCNHGYAGDGKTSCGLDTQECQNYQSLSSADRKVTNRVSVHKKDKELGPGWFRFEGSAGTRMASSCPPVYMCGTDATGWMYGSHPTVAGGTVNRKVCFHWAGNCCYWSTNIQVRNCDSYYVYYLSGTPFNLGHLRYCGSD